MARILLDETLEDLQVGGLKIIQKAQGYRFTTDSVLLANFVKCVKHKRVAELCSGSGVVSVLVAYKCRPKSISAVEIQPKLAEMSERTVRLNNQSKVIKIVNADAKIAYSFLGGRFGAVIANPPYGKLGSGKRHLDRGLDLSKHEVEINLAQLIESSARLLANRGSLFLVHKSDRVAEIFYEMNRRGIEPKELCFVKSREESVPNIALVRGVKGGKVGLKVLPDIIVFDADNNYTQTVRKLYGERRG